MTAPWCTQRSVVVQPQLILALGVLSIESNRRRRSIMRATTFATHTKQLETSFLLRGHDVASGEQLGREAAVHGDVWLVNATASLSRSVGPLVSTMLWLDCATRVHPRVPFIGRADDDVWLNVGGLLRMLSSVRVEMAARNSTRALVGQLESFLWMNDGGKIDGPAGKGGRLHKQMSWLYGHSCKACSTGLCKETGLFHGPFNFPKGQSFFLSRSLAVDVMHVMPGRVERLVDTDAQRCYVQSENNDANNCSKSRLIPLMPFDDAYVGYAISQVTANIRVSPSGLNRRADGPVLLVTIEKGLLMDGHSWSLPVHDVRSATEQAEWCPPSSHTSALACRPDDRAAPRPLVSPAMVSWHAHGHGAHDDFALEATSIAIWYAANASGCSGVQLIPSVSCTLPEFSSCGGLTHQPCFLRGGTGGCSGWTQEHLPADIVIQAMRRLNMI